jgi:hypothetical protein
MTESKKNYLKEHAFSFANLIVLLSMSFTFGTTLTTITKDIEHLKQHTQDKQLHMSFEKKIEVFVPRIELDGRLENIDNALIRIESKIDN